MGLTGDGVKRRQVTRTPAPTEVHVAADDFRQALGAYLNRGMEGERIVVTRHGAPIGVFLGRRDYEQLTQRKVGSR